MVEHDHELSPACAATREEFSGLLDEELSPTARAQVVDHLAECSDCLRALDGMKKVTDLYRALPNVPAPAGFEEAVRRAVRPRLFEFPRRARAAALLGLAAAAALALVTVPFAMRESRQSANSQLARENAEMRSAPLAESAPPVAREEKAADLAQDNSVAGAAPAAEVVPMTATVEAAPVPAAATSATETAPAAPAPPPPARAESPKKAAEVPLAAATMTPQETEPLPAPAVSAAEPLAEAAPAPASAPEVKTEPRPTTRASAKSKAAPETWDVAGRTLVVRDGLWVQQEHNGEPAKPLKRNGREFRQLVKAFPELEALIEAERVVVFKAGEQWYRLQLK